MKMKIIPFFIVFSTILSIYSNNVYENRFEASNLNSTDTISTNLVPDEETAKKIAEAIWLPIYGEKILKQRPYKAILSNNIWIVKGLIPHPHRDNPEFRGGTAYIEIRKNDCKILKVTHGR